MVLGIGMRTVWISLRALNYTDRAFRAAIKNLDVLKKAEREQVKEALKMAEIGKMNVQVGMLYAATLGMMVNNMWNMLASTEAGKAHLAELNELINETKSAFADTIFTALKPLIDIFSIFLRVLRDNEPLRILVILFASTAVLLSAMYAGYKLLVGIKQMYTATLGVAQFLEKKGLLIKVADFKTTLAQAGAHWQLAVAVAAAGGAFAVTFMLLKDMPAYVNAIIAVVLALAAAFWALFVAESAATWGIAAILGEAAAGAAMATAAAYQARGGMFAVGTRSLPYTGMFFGHKGEVVYNPISGRPTGLEPKGELTSQTNVYRIPMTIENVHTKADIDDLNEKVAEAIRKSAKRRR